MDKHKAAACKHNISTCKHKAAAWFQYSVRAAAALLFFTVLAFFFIPLAAAVLPAFTEPVSFSVRGKLLSIATFTCLQAFLSALFASIIGLCAAFFCARREFHGRKLLLSLSAVPLSMPAVVIALAFILFLGKNGFLSRFLSIISSGRYSTGTFLYSFGGVLLIHTFYNFPIAMCTISSAWEQLPEEYEQAAQIAGASNFRIFCTITAPALKTPFAAAFLIIFLYCFFSFVIILLVGGLGLTTLEAELYRIIRTEGHTAAAGGIAVIETLIAAAALGLYTAVRRKTVTTNIPHNRRKRLPLRGIPEKIFFTVLAGLITVCLLMPLASLFVYSFRSKSSGFTLAVWRNLAASPFFYKALLQTLQTGIGTACFSVVTALFFTYCVYDSEKSIYRALPFFPLAVSSIVLGAGWLRLDISPSVFVLILAQSSLAWPFAWMQIEAGFAKMPPAIFEAARLFSASRTDAFFRIVLPLGKTGIKAAFCSVFAISAGDAALPLLLHLPHFENLALLLFRLAGTYRFAESAAVGAVLAVLTGLLFSVHKH